MIELLRGGEIVTACGYNQFHHHVTIQSVFMYSRIVKEKRPPIRKILSDKKAPQKM